MEIELLKNKRGKYFHHLIGGNNKIIYHSEAYSSKQGAVKSIRSIIKSKITFTDLTQEREKTYDKKQKR